MESPIEESPDVVGDEGRVLAVGEAALPGLVIREVDVDISLKPILLIFYKNGRIINLFSIDINVK